jgi:hypothetical protein
VVGGTAKMRLRSLNRAFLSDAEGEGEAPYWAGW